MKYTIELTKEDLRKLIIAYLEDKLNIPFTEKDINIMVKSKQNYSAKWEKAAFKATVNVNT